MHFLLRYTAAQDYMERRPEFRSRHLALAWSAHERGELVLGGAVGDPVVGAVLLFKGGSPEVARAFAEADPYVTEGLVSAWSIDPWQTVVGIDAADPVRVDEV